ncbi:hypothetical protein ACFLQL_04190 [Verrucomicrobiota bacterium]
MTKKISLDEGLEKGNIADTIRWLRDETIGENCTATQNDYIYNQFDLVLDALRKRDIQ